MTLRKREGADNWNGGGSSHCVENSLWKSLWNSQYTDYVMMMIWK